MNEEDFIGHMNDLADFSDGRYWVLLSDLQEAVKGKVLVDAEEWQRLKTPEKTQ